jgi:hypothetical protein
MYGIKAGYDSRPTATGPADTGVAVGVFRADIEISRSRISLVPV